MPNGSKAACNWPRVGASAVIGCDDLGRQGCSCARHDRVSEIALRLGYIASGDVEDANVAPR
jgi:hypothetical protein